MADQKIIDIVKREVRENMCQYFDDADIEFYIDKNGDDIDKAIYELLLIKAEDSTISVSGLSTSDTSAYFRRLASRYRRYNSGVLK